MKLAIMQPYFFPYLGYFRLSAASDLIVLLDNVQFQRRGWIHRNKFTKLDGTTDWLTLPLTKGNRDETMIKDVAFRENVNFRELLNPFRIGSEIDSIKPLWPNFLEFSGNLVNYLEQTLLTTSALLGISTPIVRASEVCDKNDLAGEKYILRLCKTLGAELYINAPGGRHLYQKENFAREKIRLCFLPDHMGVKTNILERLLNENTMSLRDEIKSNVLLEER